MNLLSTHKAALLAQCTPDNIRYHAKQGRLLPIKIDRGNGRFERLYLQEDVERFVREREAARATKVNGHEAVEA
jgi:DNA-binding transcriptional MerR regulator